jgi:hypothetical protein
MAVGILPEPGSKRGPCESKCKHRDCAQTRQMAAEPCRFCQKAIGYDAGFVRARLTGSLAHVSCADEAVGRNDARLGEF